MSLTKFLPTFNTNSFSPVILIICIFLVFFFFTSPLLAQGQGEKILLLHSYHPTLRWTKTVTESVENYFKGKRPDLKIQIEYLDTKRYYSPDYRRSVSRFLRKKFIHDQFDLVITVDDHAFAFAKKHRKKLFPQVPLIFAGVNNYRPEMIKNMQQVTGVVEKLGLKKTLETAFRFHPDADTVYVINDRSRTGRANRKYFETVSPAFSDKVNFRFLTDYSMSNLLNKISKSPENSFTLLLSFNYDNQGHTYSYVRSGKLITQASNRPVYGIWHFYLGRGIVGGYLTCGKAHGRAAARIASQVLAGKPADSIPVDKAGHCKYGFDYEMLRKFNVDPAKLPLGSEVINRPRFFYQLSPTWFWAGIVVISLLGIVSITALVASIYQRRLRVRTRRSRQFLQQIIDSSPNLVTVKDESGNVILANQTLVEFVGKPSEELSGDSLNENVDSEQAMRKRIKAEREVFETGRSVYLGKEKLTKPETGETHWFITTCHPINSLEEDGLSVLTISTDISRLKEVEDQLDRERAFVEAILETAGALIVVLNKSGEIVRFNEACERVTGFKEEEVIGKNVLDVFIPSEEKTEVEETFEELVFEENYVYQENHWLTKSGEKRLIAWRNSIFSLDASEEFVVSIGTDITKERQTERELKESKQVFESFFEAANDLIMQIDEFGQIIRVNEATVNTLGYEESELVNKSLMNFMKPEAREKFIDCFPKLLESGKGRHEVQLFRKNESLLEVDCSSAAIQEKKQGTRSFVLFMRDISELKQREMRLRQYEQSIEASTELFAAVDRDKKYLFANEAYLEYHGMEKGQVVDKHLSDVLPPDIFSKVNPHVNQALGGEIVRYEMVRRHPVLGDRHLDVTYYPLTAENSEEIRGVAASFHDITARKQAEESRRKSEQRFREMASTINEVFWMADERMEKFYYVNPAVQELFGYSPSDFYDDPGCFFEAIYPGDREKVKEMLEGVSKGLKDQVEFRISKPGEEQLRWCRLRAHPLMEKEEVDRLVGTAIDITRLKNTQFELENSLAEKETLMQEIHHRVKNNLFIITSLLDMQAMEASNETVSKALSEGVDRIQVMAFVHELLYRDSELRKVRVDEYLKKLTGELVNSHLTPDKTIEVNYELDSVELDVDRIVTCGLITNELFTNAIQHAFVEQEQGKIFVKFKEEESQYILEIRDDGEGLPGDFSLVESDHLGLKLVSSLTENQLGGIIKITRSPQTIFTVKFDKSPRADRKHI